MNKNVFVLTCPTYTATPPPSPVKMDWKEAAGSPLFLPSKNNGIKTLTNEQKEKRLQQQPQKQLQQEQNRKKNQQRMDRVRAATNLSPPPRPPDRYPTITERIGMLQMAQMQHKNILLPKDSVKLCLPSMNIDGIDDNEDDFRMPIAKPLRKQSKGWKKAAHVGLSLLRGNKHPHDPLQHQHNKNRNEKSSSSNYQHDQFSTVRLLDESEW